MLPVAWPCRRTLRGPARGTSSRVGWRRKRSRQPSPAPPEAPALAARLCGGCGLPLEPGQKGDARHHPPPGVASSPTAPADAPRCSGRWTGSVPRSPGCAARSNDGEASDAPATRLGSGSDCYDSAMAWPGSQLPPNVKRPRRRAKSSRRAPSSTTRLLTKIGRAHGIIAKAKRTTEGVGRCVDHAWELLNFSSPWALAQFIDELARRAPGKKQNVRFPPWKVPEGVRAVVAVRCKRCKGSGCHHCDQYGWGIFSRSRSGSARASTTTPRRRR